MDPDARGPDPARPRAAAPLALAIGATFLCGHPQIPFYTVLLAGLWVLASALRDGPGRPRRALVSVAAYAGAVAGGLAVAAAQLLPSFLFSAEAGRSGGIDLAFAGAFSLGPRSLPGLVLPIPLGHPEIRTYWGPPNSWELCAYLGIPVIVLALLGFRRPGGMRARWLLLGILAGSILFATGTRTPLFPLLFRAVPGLDHFRVPARALIVAALMAALLAARGLDALREHPGGRAGPLARWILPALAGLGALAAAICLLAGDRLRDAAHAAIRHLYGAGAPGRSRPIGYWLEAADHACRTLPASLAAGAALLVGTVVLVRPRTRERIRYRTLVAALTALLLAESWFVGWRFLSWQPLPETTPVPPIAARLTHSGGRFRVLDQTGTLSNAVGMGARIEQVGGYDPTIPRRTMDYVAGMDGLGREPLGTTVSAERRAIDATWRRWWLDWLNVRYLLVTDDLTERGFTLLERQAREGAEDLRLFENPAARPRATLHAAWATAGSREEAGRLLRASGTEPILVVEGADAPPPGATGGAADLTEYGPDRLAVRTTSAGPSMLLVADAWSVGWKATVDGGPARVLPANLALRAVAVPAGEHTVEMRYEPRGHPAGLTITIAAALLLLGAWMATARREGAGGIR